MCGAFALLLNVVLEGEGVVECVVVLAERQLQIQQESSQFSQILLCLELLSIVLY